MKGHALYGHGTIPSRSSVVVTPGIPSSTPSKRKPVTYVSIHPQAEAESGKRFMWTDYEVYHVGTTCEWIVANTPDRAGFLLAECLEKLKQNPDKLKYFHPHHVIDSGRLRSGWEQYTIKKNKGYVFNV